MKRVCLLITEPEAVYGGWRRLVVQHQVSGKKIYDARLAAVMQSHGSDRIVTFNTKDFARYPGVTVIHPASLARAPD